METYAAAVTKMKIIVFVVFRQHNTTYSVKNMSTFILLDICIVVVLFVCCFNNLLGKSHKEMLYFTPKSRKKLFCVWKLAFFPALLYNIISMPVKHICQYCNVKNHDFYVI